MSNENETPSEITARAMHHLASALDRQTVQLSMEQPKSESARAGHRVLAIAAHGAFKTYCDGHGDHGLFRLIELAREGKPVGLDAVAMAVAPILLCSQGIEATAHDGSTFEARRQAASTLVFSLNMREW